MRIERPLLLAWLCLPIALGLVWRTYLPGLHGDFLFDDFANMPALGSTGPVTHWATFFRYITSGMADPTGRPLTLLTFLLDGHDWPTAAYPFKRTNVLLHLINGALLALLLVRLTRYVVPVDDIRKRVRAVLASITGATLWLIHPLFVSTVLYVVQREAMLPMTCVLVGLLVWLRGRDDMLQGRLISGGAWVVLGLVFFTGLGVLSKADGILLPLYALLIEYWLLNTRSQTPPAIDGASKQVGTPLPSSISTKGQRVYRRTLAILGGVPALMLVLYLLYVGVSGATHGLDRPWTMGQRLLTEPRVLFDYLHLLWMPRPFTPGLFNDQIVAPISLWKPFTTALSVVGLLTLLVVAWLLRRRHRVLSFTILFYFTGQLLESSTIPLELYFEHRNYIPAMFMFWPLSLWLWEVGRSKSGGFGWAKVALTMILISGLTVLTHARTVLWGNGQQQAVLWAKLNPQSPRAQANAANYEMAAGRPKAALRRLQTILPHASYDPQITLNILSAHCQLGGLDASDLQLANNTLAHMKTGGQLIFHWLGNAITLAANHGCPGLDSVAVASMLDAAERNPHLHDVAGRMQDIYHLRGQLALSLHQPRAALMWFEKGLALRPGPEMGFEQAALLGSAGYAAEGLNELDMFEAFPQKHPAAGFGMPSIHVWVLRRQQYWPKELVRLRATLRDDAAQQAAKNR